MTTSAVNTAPKAVVGRFVDAFAARDWDAALAELADDIRWEVMGGHTCMPPGTSVIDGKEAARGFFEVGFPMMYDMQAPLTVTVRSVVGDGDMVLVEWVVDATTASGKDYHNEYAMVFTVGEAGITDLREYTNTHYGMQMFFSAT